MSRSLRAPMLQQAQCALLVCAVLLASACSEPSFVSLGRNSQSVESSSADAGSLPDSLLPTGADSCGNPQLSSDDPATPGADLSFGCELEPQGEPLGLPVCGLVGEILPIDSACEQRRPLPCPEADGQPASPSHLLFDVIGRCTDLAYQITVTFAAGCATAFSIEAREPLVAPSVRACVAARLAAERYDCAQTVDCATGGTFPPVTR